jgi:hypothetical protein
MADTLDLDVITRKVKTSDWSGLEAALKEGLSFHDNSGGVLGNAGEVFLGEGVQPAVMTDHVLTDEGEVKTIEKTGTYRLGKRLADGAIEIILEVNGDGAETEVKVFTLTPGLELKHDNRVYLTTASECET